MIEFTSGDMFARPADIRVNTVNCKGVMGAGVALAFKTRYPEMFKDYKKACHDGLVKPGSMHVWKNLLGDWIINFPTKRDWREPSRYDDIISGLDALRKYLEGFGEITVALPALGCGHGGLDWNRVSSMIKDKLGDLKARILVFEPIDSRNAGRASQEPSANKHSEDIELLGYRAIELPLHIAREGLPSMVLVKGDEALLTRSWIALLPSKDPGERELAAIGAIARQMASHEMQTVVALVYATRASEHIAEIFLKEGIAVILILPFGPLTRKTVPHFTTKKKLASFAIVSVAAPTEAWKRPILAQSMTLLRSGARSILLTDPAPDWLMKGLKAWATQPMFYLRYEAQPEDLRRLLDQQGARAISRRQDTGEPNLSPLFPHNFPSKDGNKETFDEGEKSFTFLLTQASALHLLGFVKEMEGKSDHDGRVRITIACAPGTGELQATLLRFLKDDILKD